jgi:pentatricopeptide repeat protein
VGSWIRTIQTVCPAPRHTNIINAFAKVSQHRAAIEWLDVMEDAHHSPNVLSFTCAIEVGIRSESDGVNRCPFGCGHCHGHCQACLWATEWGEALRLLQRMQQRGHRVYLKCFWHLKSCEVMHENHEIIYIYIYIYVLSLRVEIPEIYMFRRWNLIHHPFSARSGVPADSVLIRKLNRQMGSEAQTFVLVAWQMWYQKFTDIWCLFVWKRFGNTSYINRGVNKKLSY